jgi:hypothetical protein
VWSTGPSGPPLMVELQVAPWRARKYGLSHAPLAGLAVGADGLSSASGLAAVTRLGRGELAPLVEPPRAQASNPYVTATAAAANENLRDISCLSCGVYGDYSMQANRNPPSAGPPLPSANPGLALPAIHGLPASRISSRTFSVQSHFGPTRKLRSGIRSVLNLS